MLREDQRQNDELDSDSGPEELSDIGSQFSLSELCWLVTLATSLMVAMVWLSPRIFAGVAGVAAFIGLCILSRLHTSRASIHIGWWILLGAYFLAAGVAIVRH